MHKQPTGWCPVCIAIDTSISLCKYTAATEPFPRTIVRFLSIFYIVYFPVQRYGSRKQHLQFSVVSFSFLPNYSVYFSFLPVTRSKHSAKIRQRKGGVVRKLSPSAQKCSQMYINAHKYHPAAVCLAPTLPIAMQIYGKRKAYFPFIAVYTYFCSLLRISSAFFQNHCKYTARETATDRLCRSLVIFGRKL